MGDGGRRWETVRDCLWRWGTVGDGERRWGAVGDGGNFSHTMVSHDSPWLIDHMRLTTFAACRVPPTSIGPRVCPPQLWQGNGRHAHRAHKIAPVVADLAVGCLHELKVAFGARVSKLPRAGNRAPRHRMPQGPSRRNSPVWVEGRHHAGEQLFQAHSQSLQHLLERKPRNKELLWADREDETSVLGDAAERARPPNRTPGHN
eukprot:15441110-Alexandrium_andersonii.AAC.1